MSTVSHWIVVSSVEDGEPKLTLVPVYYERLPDGSEPKEGKKFHLLSDHSDSEKTLVWIIQGKVEALLFQLWDVAYTLSGPEGAAMCINEVLIPVVEDLLEAGRDFYPKKQTES